MKGDAWVSDHLNKALFNDLIAGIGGCEVANDYVSRALLRHCLIATEQHIDWLETQPDLIKSVGVQNCLQAQMGRAS